MTSTAMLRIPSLVCGLSVFRCVIHILPSSFSASLISLIRILSRTLLAWRRSFSRTALVPGSSQSSSALEYLRDLFVPFPCDVELTVDVLITPVAKSLLEGFVSPPLLSGGSFLFSKEMYLAFVLGSLSILMDPSVSGVGASPG